MIKPEVVANHVEALLEAMLGSKALNRGSDGEWPIRQGTALYSVRVRVEEQRPHVEVYSVALAGVKESKRLYARLNELNQKTSHSRWFLDGHNVVVAAELLGETLDVEELSCTCGEV